MAVLLLQLQHGNLAHEFWIDDGVDPFLEVAMGFHLFGASLAELILDCKGGWSTNSDG
jgi:hypothetical protein